MALQVYQGTLQSPTATGSQSYTGVGFQPKAILFFSGALAADGYAAGMGPGIGAYAQSEQASIGARTWSISSTDNVSTTATASIQNAAVICVPNPATTTTDLLNATMTSLNADGFTLNWVTVQATARNVHYLALGGTDLTDAFLGRFTNATATGNQAYTGTGFQPDAIIFFHAFGAAGASHSASASQWGIGVAVSSTQRWAFGSNARNAQTMTGNQDAMHLQRADSCIVRLDTLSALFYRADFVSMDANGFTLNWLNTNTGGTETFYYLALKGGQYAAGANNKPTGAATANQDVSLPFVPTGLFLGSSGLATSTSIIADQEYSLGASDFTRESALWFEYRDVLLPTEANTSTVGTKALRLATGATTTNAECDSSINGSGFRLAWTTNNAVAAEICYLAMGDAVVDPFPALPWKGHPRQYLRR